MLEQIYISEVKKMQFRLKTSKKTEEIYAHIFQREHLQPFALAKISIALAVESGFKVGQSSHLDDSDGLDLNRQTITGENDILFKALIDLNEGKFIDEEEYFPDYVKQYIDYGAKLLEQEMKYGHSFYTHLVSLEKGL